MANSIIDIAKYKNKGGALKEFDPETATSIINGIAVKYPERILYNAHALSQMRNRGITTKDIVDVLEGGIVTLKPKLDQFNEWRYKVTFERFRGDKELSAITVIKRGSKLLVVTAY